MKNIQAKELQTNLEAVLTAAQTERVVISRQGKPCAVLVGIEAYDAEDLRLATSAGFWQMIKRRRRSGRSLPIAEVDAHLKARRKKLACRQTTPKRASNNR